jgi:hypothetical protein
METTSQKLEKILATENFKGLKAILDHVCSQRDGLCDKIKKTESYETLLGELGYRVNVIKQIHVQDCYSRVGPAGGIKAVLPYHDIATHSSLPTLVHFDSSVTTTPKSSGFFNACLMTLKTQLSDGPVSTRV